ncbi:BPI fold-containing family C protein [Zootoca vivipara]|uniref:BPI fold-containing family C protein n=1 Tax=Zootoca vivipara TaxID=8524 RepID=UPI00293BE972|nr:BPI fold-containing family C protein [Zootoca vivipara]
MKVCGLLFLLSLFTPWLDAKPGIKVKITQKGLDYGKQLGIDFLEQRLKEQTFANVSGQETFGFTGADYTISEIKVNAVEFPNASVSLIPGTGIKLEIKDAAAAVTAHWRADNKIKGRQPPVYGTLSPLEIGNSGKMSVLISHISLAAVVSVSQDNAGHAVLLLESCKGKVDRMHIELDQDTSWLYKYFANHLEKPACDSLSNNMCPFIGSEIEKINAELREHKVQAQIDSFAQVDYSLVNSPVISSTSINFDIKGTVSPVGNDLETPFKPAPFSIPEEINSMLHIGISEYFLQSASLVYYASGAFDVSIAKELSSYFRLTTNSFGTIIPKIARSFKTPCPVILDLKPTAAPVIRLHNGSAVLEIAGSMEVLVVLKNSTTRSMFTLNIAARTHVALNIFEQKLIPSLCLDR